MMAQPMPLTCRAREPRAHPRQHRLKARQHPPATQLAFINLLWFCGAGRHPRLLLDQTHRCTVTSGCQFRGNSMSAFLGTLLANGLYKPAQGNTLGAHSQYAISPVGAVQFATPLQGLGMFVPAYPGRRSRTRSALGWLAARR